MSRRNKSFSIFLLPAPPPPLPWLPAGAGWVTLWRRWTVQWCENSELQERKRQQGKILGEQSVSVKMCLHKNVECLLFLKKWKKSSNTGTAPMGQGLASDELGWALCDWLWFFSTPEVLFLNFIFLLKYSCGAVSYATSVQYKDSHFFKIILQL